MKLDKLVLVNWGQLRPGDFEMGDMTLFTGETGSGKTTMIDALQTVMTGANKSILTYNAGQDEVSQGPERGKTKRTLESYVVGGEYSNFSRPHGAQGFMAAVFRPSKGEEGLKPFTALVAASARVEGTPESRQARLESLALVIVDDAALTYEDFMKDTATGECIEVERIVRHLQTKYPHQRVHDFHDHKMDYLCALFGRFRGKTSVTRDEATNASKAWVQSIAFKPIGSVHELVRDEILDFDEKQLQQDIERISGLMRQVSNLRKESIRLQKNVSSLDGLKSALKEASSAYETQVLQDMFVAKLTLKNDEETIASKKRQIVADTETSRQEAGRITGWKDRVKVLDNQRIDLTARLQGIPAHAKKQELETSLTRAAAEAKATLNTLYASLRAAGLLEQRANELIARPIPDEFKKLKASVSKIAEALRSTDFSRLAACRDAVVETANAPELNVERLYGLVQAFQGMNQGVSALIDALIGPDESVSLAVAAESATLGQQKTEADRLVKELSNKKERLARGKVSYPRSTEVALSLLQEQLPEANVQVLCDLVEPKGEQWQQAIEGYLDGARFNLIVDTAWEARALNFLKSKNISAKVVQGALCLKHASGKQPASDSIVHELRSANPIAWAYLVDQYGGVVKVKDSEELRDTPRGLTVDGKGSAGRTMFTCEYREPVFGQKARQAALARTVSDLQTAEDAAARLGAMVGDLESIKRALQGLTQPHFDAAPLQECAQVIDQSRQSLASLDIRELNDIEVKLKQVTADIDDFNTKTEDAQRRQIELEGAVKAANGAIKAIEGNKLTRLDAVDLQIKRMKHLVESNPALTYTQLTAEVESRLSAPNVNLEAAMRQAELLSKKPDPLLIEAREALYDYNAQAKADERFGVTLVLRHDVSSFEANYQPLVSLENSVSVALEGLRGIGLYNNRIELDKAEKSFHDVFTKQFCVEIKSRVDEGIRTLRQMNHELRNLKFGLDSFSIDWSKWEPEFEDYLSFFEAVTKLADSAEPMDLFGEAQLTNKHVEIRDRLVKLLLDEDQERATKELLRIADYRNYRRYDILNTPASGGKVVKLSEWGTGSGGQLETPAYIVRAAVVTNRLKLFEKGPSLKLLASDESFSRMDEARARAVLGFLRDNLDLQVISAMPTRNAASFRDEFTREYSFTRLRPVENGELDFVSECDERIYKSDKMRELWARQRQIAREKAKQLFDAANPESAEDSAVQPS
jgi:hypothetical protein